MEKDALQALPNIGPETAKQLREVGVNSHEDLEAMGAKEAWLRILQMDPSACYNRLMGLEGAVRMVPKKLLPQEVKDDLKSFYREAKG